MVIDIFSGNTITLLQLFHSICHWDMINTTR